MPHPINVAIVGITGITGEELLRIFEVYPEVNLVAVTARQEERSLGQLYPQYTRFKNLKISPFDLKNFIDLKVQIVFVALPHGEAMQMVPDLLKNNMRVIDLGADFRLKDRQIFEKWYVPHTAWDEMAHAVYGMVEFNRSQIRGAKLVANPGCYVTAATFALLPLLQAKIISKTGIIIDAKSGVSGGGRKLVAEKASWNDSFKAYGVTGHRHLPEIEQNINTSAVFIPHLLPLDRGIVAGVAGSGVGGV
jgi:N-acetyl-gamma-glutamyl-phosphate reductase